MGGLTWIAAMLVIAIGLALLARARPLLDL